MVFPIYLNYQFCVKADEICYKYTYYMLSSKGCAQLLSFEIKPKLLFCKSGILSVFLCKLSQKMVRGNI